MELVMIVKVYWAIIVDNSGNVSLENIEAEKIKFTPDYEAGKSIFRHVFKELSNNNNGLVACDKLQERL